MTEPSPAPEPPQVQAWVAPLVARLSADGDFRQMFERTPGKAAHSVGIPYDEVRALMAGAPGYEEAMARIRAALGICEPGRFGEGSA